MARMQTIIMDRAYYMRPYPSSSEEERNKPKEGEYTSYVYMRKCR